MITEDKINPSWMFSSERVPADAWELMRVLVFQRDNFTCRFCGARNGVMHCDHVTPLALGGTNSPYNLQTLCRRCNIRKGKSRSGFVIKAAKMRLWHRLIIEEPRLLEVFQIARSINDDFAQPSFCANAHFYGWIEHLEGVRPYGLKAQLSELVGDSQRGRAVLGTREAYDAAYEVIYNALPPCRNCLCG